MFSFITILVLKCIFLVQITILMSMTTTTIITNGFLSSSSYQRPSSFLQKCNSQRYFLHNNNDNLNHDSRRQHHNYSHRSSYNRHNNVGISRRRSSNNNNAETENNNVVTKQQKQQEQSNINIKQLELDIIQLKKVLEREYLSFFNPMECEWYKNNVVFEDPLTSLIGIDNYQKNVDMLSGRTLFGNILFGNTPRDAKILLHKITGGTILENNNNNGENLSSYGIEDIITRWTLQFKFKALPWKPIAQFSGISQYKIEIKDNSNDQTSSNSRMIQIVKQNDYWDSINLLPDGTGINYNAVDKTIAIQHFVSLLKPNSVFQAEIASLELPYETLRLGRESKYKKPMIGQYEVRRYPSYIAIQIPYTRRDDAFQSLGALARGLKPLAPTFVIVDDDNSKKTMMWPLKFVSPNDSNSLADGMKQISTLVERNNNQEDMQEEYEIVIIPEQIVAVGRFTDAIVESIVRTVRERLLEICDMDGLQPVVRSSTILKFAQYNAVYSMGQRRSEVHIELKDGGHPW